MSIAGGIPVADLNTVMATIVHKTPVGKYEHITETRYWPLLDYLIKKRKMGANGGTKIVHDIVLQPKGMNKGRKTNPFADDSIDTNENMIQMVIDWVILNHNMMWEERQIQAAADKGGKGKAAAISIQNWYKSLYDQNITIPWADDMEDQPWLVPQNTADKKATLGIPYWINYAPVGGTTEGWVGQTVRYGDGSTGTVVAGIDKATNPLWRNRVQFWSGNVDHQIIAKMRAMFQKLKFKKPPGGDTNVREATNKNRFLVLCGEDVFLELQNLADARGAAGKNDLVAVDGEVKFYGIPIVPVPQLDEAANNTYKPIYFLNLDTWYFWVANGEWMKKVGPDKFPINTKPRTWGLQVYTQFQFMCVNPYQNGVMHIPIPNP